MKGYRGGMFKGNETVNRYEMAIIVSRLMKKAGGKGVGADVRRTMDRLGEEFMDELDLIGARLTALENAFHEHVTDGGDAGAFSYTRMMNSLYFAASMDRDKRLFIGQSVIFWNKTQKQGDDAAAETTLDLLELGPRVQSLQRR